MEITVKFKSASPVQEFGQNGSTKREFVCEFDDKPIAFVSYGKTCDSLTGLTIGEKINISFDIQSREYNGRWYTDLKAWKISSVQFAANGAPQSPQSPQSPPKPKPTPAVQAHVPDVQDGDDLPF